MKRKRPAGTFAADVASGSDVWEVVLGARRVARPSSGVYLASSFESFIELHGDRRYRDDESIRGGIASLAGQTLVAIGHERGRTHEEQVRRNFGMPFPEGYHKAHRLMRMAEHFRLPVVTLVDTPGAYPGLGAEERGQAGAIAEMLRCMASLEVPTVSVIIGQGGSGGALALAMADRVLMLENAIYSVISPEGCASILWHGTDRAPEAAVALRLTAHELLDLHVIDEVIREPPAGNDLELPACVARAIRRHLRQLGAVDPAELTRRRLMKYATMGVFHDEPGTLEMAPQ